MKKNFQLFLFTLIFIAGSLAAQTDSIQKQTGIISGIARDSVSNLPVISGLVQLQEINDKLLQYSETGKSGEFSFKNIPYGLYKLQIIKDNYSPYNTEINLNSEELDLNNILMSKSVTTQEILVEGVRPFMEIQDDKKIFNVENNIVTQGKTAIDIFKTLPLVTVDEQDNVMLRGDAKVKILVNGKENRMYSNLRQIPADIIQKVEIITTPSARYEAEGVTGIINIILKKTSDFGYTGMVNIGGNSDNTYNTFGNFNLKKSGLSLFTNIGAGSWKNEFVNNSRRENFLTTPSTLISNSSGDNRGRYYFGSFGAEYDLSKESVAGIDFSINGWKGENPQLTTQIFSSEAANYTSIFNNITKYDGINLNSSIYFNKKFDTPDKELNADFTFGKNNWNNNFDQEHEIVPPSIIRDGRKIKGNTYTAQIDYIHPFNSNLKLETGYKGSFNLNNNETNVDSLDSQTNSYVIDNSRSLLFNYDNFVNGFYTTIANNFGSASLKLGGRYEFTNTEFDLGTPVRNSQEYSDFFPTAALTYRFGMLNSLQLSYSRRINRPNMWSLNPFIYIYNNQNISFGNPALKPEYTNSFELGVNTSAAGINISPNFYYRKTTDVITRYSYLTDTNTTVSTYDNSSKLDSYGADLIFSGMLFEVVSFNASLNVSKLSFSGTAGSSLDNDGTAFGGRVYLSFPVASLANIELFYNRWGDRVSAQGTNKGKNFLTIGISKMFLDNKIRINMSVNDVLAKTNSPESYTNGIGFRQTYINDFKQQNLNFTLSYNFGNTQPQSKRKKTRTEQQQNPTQDDGGVR